MIRILIVYHSQTGNTEKIAEAVAGGVMRTKASKAVLKRAFETTADDVRTCDAIVLCSPEYFGYMAGVVKDFFDRTYEELKNDQGSIKKPYAVVICAGNDGTGALRHIERLCTGYRFRKVQNPVICKGAVTEEILMKCRDLGETIAEGVNIGIF